jgi:nucleotide-binding universal stress UspA family protein
LSTQPSESSPLLASARGSARDTPFGHTAREIIDDAEANDVDVIVTGSQRAWRPGWTASRRHGAAAAAGRPEL